MMARTWLVTGCSTGMGRALAETLLERGEQVVATARNPATLDRLVSAYPGRALSATLDITRDEDIAAVVGAAEARFGLIDGLINNAGYGDMGTIEDTPIAVARAMMDTNLFGTIAMIRAVLPAMRARRAGQIVNIGSVAGLIGFPALGYYCASKFALVGLTEALAAEVRGLGIRVTIAELGSFATDFTRSMTITPPSTPDYDFGALSQAAGTSHWGAGDDPRAGAAALLDAIDAPAPPLHLILGRDGLDIVASYDTSRREERARWLATSRLEGDHAGA